MRFIPAILSGLALAASTLPAAAQMTTTYSSDAVRSSSLRPEITAALATGAATADAILRHDASAFSAAEAPELMINSPADRVLSGAQALGAFKAGLIDYGSIERVVEFATVRPNGEVLWMGAEHVTPRNANRNAGRAVTYRVTEIYRPDGATWKLAVRQATIVQVK